MSRRSRRTWEEIQWERQRPQIIKFLLASVTPEQRRHIFYEHIAKHQNKYYPRYHLRFITAAETAEDLREEYADATEYIGRQYLDLDALNGACEVAVYYRYRELVRRATRAGTDQPLLSEAIRQIQRGEQLPPISRQKYADPRARKTELERARRAAARAAAAEARLQRLRVMMVPAVDVALIEAMGKLRDRVGRLAQREVPAVDGAVRSSMDRALNNLVAARLRDHIEAAAQ